MCNEEPNDLYCSPNIVYSVAVTKVMKYIVL